MLDTISSEERRDAERARRIARAREERAARPTAQALAAKAAATGNGGPPMLAAPTEMRAIGEAMYGRRWTTELAEDLGEDPRQLRRWMAGEAAVPALALAAARRAARRRLSLLDALVGRDD